MKETLMAAGQSSDILVLDYFLDCCRWSLKVIAPVCFNKSNRSTTSQCSTILPFSILYRSADLIFTSLFVGVIPSNSPLCVPLKFRNTRTKSFSARICSIFTCRSGKPENSVVKNFLNDSAVFPGTLVRFAAWYLSITSRLCLLKTSSINDLISSLLLPCSKECIVVVVLLSFISSRNNLADKN